MDQISPRSTPNLFLLDDENELERAPSSVTISENSSPLPFDFDDEIGGLIEFHNVPQICSKLSNCEVLISSGLLTAVTLVAWHYLNYLFNPDSKIYMHFTFRM